MKKIISYSLYGNNPKYLKGVEENCVLAKTFYPGWTVRVYTDQDLNPSLEHMNSNLEVIKKKKEQGHLGLFWRFEVLKDRSIDYAIVRDLDSRLGERESKAVAQWMSSNRAFHIMRDHYYHNAKICGGMWGNNKAGIYHFSDKYDTLKKHYFESLTFNETNMNPRGQYFNTDQPFLWKYVWPEIVNNHLAHIDMEYKERLTFTGFEEPFPTEKEDTFVGEPID